MQWVWGWWKDWGGGGIWGCGATQCLSEAPSNHQRASLRQAGLGACRAWRNRQSALRIAQDGSIMATTTPTSCPFRGFGHGILIYNSRYGHEYVENYSEAGLYRWRLKAISVLNVNQVVMLRRGGWGGSTKLQLLVLVCRVWCLNWFDLLKRQYGEFGSGVLSSSVVSCDISHRAQSVEKRMGNFVQVRLKLATRGPCFYFWYYYYLVLK